MLERVFILCVFHSHHLFDLHIGCCKDDAKTVEHLLQGPWEITMELTCFRYALPQWREIRQMLNLLPLKTEVVGH